jgi:glycosyltransferase involved in cell wall biosynthesis
MIADAHMGYGSFSIEYFFLKTDIFFSNVILSNSKAGLKAYNVNTPKAKVIWNGVHLKRFQQKFVAEEVRNKFKVKTRFMIVMVAAFTIYKDYNLFLDTAKELRKMRDDVTFVGIGDGPSLEHIQKRIRDEQIDNVILTGSQEEVERIVEASDIGLLCTFSEGISNSIIEYMALGKPVISTDINGGSKEIIIDGITGYCIERDPTKTANILNALLNNSEFRISMGEKGRQRILSSFSIDRMGKEFQLVFDEVLSKN